MAEALNHRLPEFTKIGLLQSPTSGECHCCVALRIENRVRRRCGRHPLRFFGILLFWFELGIVFCAGVTAGAALTLIPAILALIARITFKGIPAFLSCKVPSVLVASKRGEDSLWIKAINSSETVPCLNMQMII